MQNSQSSQVKKFYTEHETQLKAWAAEDQGKGAVIGLWRSLKPDRYKIPFPCRFHWAQTQMYETTPYVQQLWFLKISG